MIVLVVLLAVGSLRGAGIDGRRLSETERDLHSAVKVNLTQEQFDALVSLVYDLGPGPNGAGEAIRLINEGKNAAAAKWIKSQITELTVVHGKVKRVSPALLVERRKYEAAPFEAAGKKRR